MDRIARVLLRELVARPLFTTGAILMELTEDRPLAQVIPFKKPAA